MKTSPRHAALFAAAAVLISTISLAAHHGNAVYDTRKSVTVKGTVVKWQFINPHSGLWVETKTAAGVEVWSAEFGGVLDLYRSFKWNKDTFKHGDQVTVIGNPEREGKTAMLARKIIVAGGAEVDLEGT